MSQNHSQTMKIKYFLTILITLIYSFGSFSQTVDEIVATLDVDTLMNNGPKNNRVNIAFANLTNTEGTYTYDTKEALNNGIDEDCDGSDTIVLNVSDFVNETFKIYPNPAKTNINLKINNQGKDYSIKIYNMYGSLIIEEKNTRKININTIKNGIYLLTVSFPNSPQTKIIRKIIVQK